MKNRKTFLQIDWFIQITIIAILTILLFMPEGIIFALLGLIPFGGWQVLSAILLTINRFDRARAGYLGVVAAYVMFLYFELFKSVTSVLLLIVPVILGIFYLALTYQEKQTATEEDVIEPTVDSKILDEPIENL